MSKELTIAITLDEYAVRVGRLVLQLWQQEKQIQVLENRVDELDPMDPEEAKDA